VLVHRLRLPAIAMVTAAAVASTGALAGSALAGPADGQPAWRVWTTTGGPSGDYASLSATGPGNVWVTGTVGKNSALTIRHWNGSAWSALSLPVPVSPPEGTWYHEVVGTSSATNAWEFASLATFSASYTEAMHRSGGTWTTARQNGGGGVAAALVFSASNAWQFRYNVSSHPALHYNGHTWSPVPVPVIPWAAAPGATVSATGPSDIWAVGAPAAHQYSPQLQPAVYNGKAWKTLPLAGLGLGSQEYLFNPAILAQSTSSAWLYTGTQKFEPHAGINQTSKIILAHWTGSSWQRVTIPGGTANGGVLASDGHGGLWLTNITLAGVDEFLHYHAGTWSRTPVPAVKGYPRAYVQALVLVPGTTSMWAAGSVGTTNGTQSQAALWKLG
jgi:hypothetical protein